MLLQPASSARISEHCALYLLCRWQSFHRGGSVALYVALYAVGYLLTRGPSLTDGSYMPLIFISYMAITILGTYFAFGAIGFVCSYIFVHYIFTAAKAD